MARPLRIEFPGAVYHLTARGNERKRIYRDDVDRQHFLALLAQVVERFHVLVHGYVLMDNHYHALAETLEANLARVIRQLNGDYAQYFNRRHRRVGHLFQARYKALLVDRDAYLVELSRYIHLNPVRAGMVGRATEHQWSSAAAYVGAAPVPVFLTVAEVLGHFGGTLRGGHSRYREFLHEAEDGRGPGSPWGTVVGQTLLGDPDWVRDMRADITAWRAAGAPRDRADGEVPAWRQLRLRPTLDDVIEAVAAGMRVDREAICRRHSRNQARAVALYLAQITCGVPQKEIAALFGVGHSAVSKAAAQVSGALAHQPHLRRIVDTLRTKVVSRVR
jgi:putative transposase